VTDARSQRPTTAPGSVCGGMILGIDEWVLLLIFNFSCDESNVMEMLLETEAIWDPREL